MAWLACVLFLAPGFASASAAPSGSTTWAYGGGCTLRLDPRPGLSITSTGYPSETPLLTIRPGSSRDSARRRRQDPEIFSIALYEGIENGHRGFSQFADDDNDGRTDEDRADGVDNDGDGRIDEDFAAIGDRMQVLNVSGAGGVRHVEAFHWAYPHLEEILFVKWRRSGREDGLAPEPGPGVLLLECGDGDWREFHSGDPATDLGSGSRERGAAGPGALYTASVRTPAGPRWLGVAILGPDGGPDAVLDGPSLRLAHSGGLDCAVIVTETLQGLAYRFDTARAVKAGARPSPDAPAVPWLVPPLRSVEDYPDPPCVRLAEDPTAGIRISLDVAGGWQWLPDPAKIDIGGRRLGRPGRVSWTPASGGETISVDWPAEPAMSGRGLLQYGQTYPGRSEILSGATRGELVFTFPDEDLPAHADRVVFETLCGQTISLRAETRRIEDVVEVSDRAASEILTDDPPALSQDLLDVYPNPFRDTVLLRFTIPRLIRDGFVWDEDRPPLLDPAAPIPYSSETPQVSLRIYSLAGHEVASLFENSCGFGQYNASWNGLSDSGRLMATGTYFCKLQIDKWSTTKRIVLLR